MRGSPVLLALVLIAGCGRIGFGTIGGADDAGDGAVGDGVGDDAVPGGLVAFYDMESFNAGTLIDNTGRGHTGTCVDPQCPIVTGGHNSTSALTFDGVDDEIVIADAADLHTQNALSISMWVFVPIPPLDFSCVVNKIANGTDMDSYQLCVTPAAAMNFGGGTAGTQTVTSPNSIDANGWHYVVATWDGTTMSIYLEGALVVSQVGSPFEFDSGPLVLGIDLDLGVQVAPFTGTLDELRIYDRVLSVAEIAAFAAS